MDKRVDIEHALLDDYIDVVYVESSCRHIGGDQNHVGLWVSVVFQSTQPFGLREISLKTSKTCVLHPFVSLYFQLSLCEDKYLKVSIRLNELSNKSLLCMVVLAKDDFVTDRSWHLGLSLTNKVNHNWVFHVFSGYLLNVLRHSCRKNHSLGIWHEPLDTDDVLVETHVKHFVSFIKDLVLRAVDM